MKKKGIALVSILVIVLVLAILVSGVALGGSDILLRSRKLKFANEILQVEKLTKDYEIRKNKNLDFEIISYNLDSITDETRREYFINEADEDGNILLYVVDLSKIDSLESIRGNYSSSEADRYLYSSKSKKVYYDKGLDIGGTIYFGINSEIESMLK